jgi:hypothetical protein
MGKKSLKGLLRSMEMTMLGNSIENLSADLVSFKKDSTIVLIITSNRSRMLTNPVSVFTSPDWILSPRDYLQLLEWDSVSPLVSEFASLDLQSHLLSPVPLPPQSLSSSLTQSLTLSLSLKSSLHLPESGGVQKKKKRLFQVAHRIGKSQGKRCQGHCPLTILTQDTTRQAVNESLEHESYIDALRQEGMKRQVETSLSKVPYSKS